MGSLSRRHGLLAEELGELAQATRKGAFDDQLHEIGYVLAWLASLAYQLGVDLEEAVARFNQGCPSCSSTPCSCELSFDRPYSGRGGSIYE